MLLQIAARNLEQLVDRLAHRIIEPGLDAEMEEGDGKTGHHYGRRHRHATEQQNQPDMQARTGGTAAALDPHAGQACRQHRAEQQDRRKIAENEADPDARLQPERRAAGEEDERGETDAERGRGQHQGQRLAEKDVGDPCQQGAGRALHLHLGFGQRGRLGLVFGSQRPGWRCDVHMSPRTTGISRSRIFLRSVLRLSPSMAAALIWLPRVAASVRRISGRSTSAITLS